MRKITRAEVIDKFVEADFDVLGAVDFKQVLREGVRGYEDWTNRELEDRYGEIYCPEEKIRVIGRKEREAK